MREIAAEAFASPLEATATVLRLFTYVGTLLSAGGMLFTAVIHDRRPVEHRRLARAVTIAATAAAAATLLAVAIQAALLGDRGLVSATDGVVLAGVFASPFGTSALVRAAALVVVAIAVRALWRPWAVALGPGAAVVASGSFLLSGHTVQAEPGWLAITSALTHTTAAAAWFGGLLGLGLTMRARRGDGDAAATAGVVSRFSMVATAAAILVSMAGAARVATLMPFTLASLGTRYGSVMVAKVLVVGVVFMVAGYNHRYLVPAVRAAAGGERRLRATVRFEALALVVVVALSVVLADLPPSRTPPAAAASGTPHSERQGEDP